ncbi:CidA/LrgA family protein [candidate division KSB1 bacterium]|nr:CidA/LrgA family protein [candidate division KSB1 bacterium]
MLGSLAILLIFQLLGEVFVRLLSLPIPGPVIGMLLLFFTLVFRRRDCTVLRNTAHGLLKYLALLFVPAGTGIIVYFSQVQHEWLPILLILIVTTLITILVTAATMQWLQRYLLRRE